MSNSVLNSALKLTARKLSVDYKVVEAVYRSYWKFVKNTVDTKSFKGISKDEFDTLTTNFNIPYIGKLYASYDKIQKHNNQIKYCQDVKAKKNQANRLSGTGD